MTGIADIEARRRIVRALRAGDERGAFELVSAHMPLVYQRMSRPFMTAEQRRVDLAALCATSLVGRRDDIARLNREMAFARRGSAPGGFICVVDLAHDARGGDWRGACRRIGQIMQYDGHRIPAGPRVQSHGNQLENAPHGHGPEGVTRVPSCSLPTRG